MKPGSQGRIMPGNGISKFLAFPLTLPLSTLSVLSEKENQRDRILAVSEDLLLQ